MPDNQKQATLVFVRGLPGSGKSTIVEAATKLLPEDTCAVLDPDATDYESEEYTVFCKEQLAQGVEEKLLPYRYLRSQSQGAIEEGRIIFWNQAFTNLESFKKVVNKHKEIAENADVNLTVLVVEVSVEPTVAKNRVAQRALLGGHDVAEERFNRFIEDYRSFEDDGFIVFKLNGEENVQSNALLLKEKVSSLR